jgi:hypothetical protein
LKSRRKPLGTGPNPPADKESGAADRQGYRLRVVSITYAGDDAAAARGIADFLRLRRARRQQELQIESHVRKTDDP